MTRKQSYPELSSAVPSVYVRALLRAKGGKLYRVAPEATFNRAAALTEKAEVDALPVIAQSGLVGIMSNRDHARPIILRGLNSHVTCDDTDIPRQVIAVSPDSSQHE